MNSGGVARTRLSRTTLGAEAMKIGVTSQNFRTITGHAGKTRRFLVFEPDGHGGAQETDRWDLSKEMSMHEFRGDAHPLDTLDVLITAGAGQGFRERLRRRGVLVVATSASDPWRAVIDYLAGRELPPPQPHHHDVNP
jgi:predicted Fe-Mo cluster-binding NifX family protein